MWSSGCSGHKAKRLVLQCINGVSSNPVEGRTQICQLKDLNHIVSQGGRNDLKDLFDEKFEKLQVMFIVMVFYTTFDNISVISRWSVILEEEAGVMN